MTAFLAFPGGSGPAPYGTLIQHTGLKLASGESLLIADGSAFSPVVYPRLAEVAGQRAKILGAIIGQVKNPLVSATQALNYMLRPKADLANKYLLSAGQSSSNVMYIQEIEANVVYYRLVGVAYNSGQVSVSSNKAKKLVPYTDDTNTVTAALTINSQKANAAWSATTIAGAVSEASPICSLMKSDGSQGVLLFVKSGSGAQTLCRYTSTLANASAPAWTAQAEVNLSGGAFVPEGAAVGNTTLSYMALAGRGEVIYTTNSGGAWTRRSFGVSGEMRGLCSHADGQTAAVRNADKLFITSDGWATFRECLPPQTLLGAYGTTLVTHGIQEGARRVFALYRTTSGGSNGNVFIVFSDDHGLTWSEPILYITTAFDSDTCLLIPPDASYCLTTASGSGMPCRFFDMAVDNFLPLCPGYKVIADII